MDRRPPVNATLREFEVRPEDLVEGNLYLIDAMILDNNNCRFKGQFIRNQIIQPIHSPVILSFFTITESLPKTGCFNRNGAQPSFLNTLTRYYTPPTQPLMDESAQRQYRKREFEKMVNAKDSNANDDENYLQNGSIGNILAQEYLSPRKKPNRGGRKTKRVKKNTKKNNKKRSKINRKNKNKKI
jgi:hypothetical protein